jgi:hypothetical protein
MVDMAAPVVDPTGVTEVMPAIHVIDLVCVVIISDLLYCRCCSYWICLPCMFRKCRLFSSPHSLSLPSMRVRVSSYSWPGFTDLPPATELNIVDMSI